VDLTGPVPIIQMYDPKLAKVEDASYTRHPGQSRSRLLRALDNEGDPRLRWDFALLKALSSACPPPAGFPNG